jgi:hypothetical protein
MSGCMTPGLLAGMATADLQAWLAKLQTAYLQINAGKRTVTVSYAQGDGGRSVTFTATTPAQIAAAILQVQQQLGMVRRARRPLRPIFR